VKKQVIHVGDTVKVVRCRFVRRVGYPLVWFDLKDEVAKDERTFAAWQALTGKDLRPARLPLVGLLCPELPDDFVECVARLRVAERNFGGNERSLHYREVDPSLPMIEVWGGGVFSDKPVPDVTGMLLKVWGKRTVMTGTRYPAWSDNEDYCSGGLKDRKTRVLLSAEYGEIEDCDVELVQKGTMHHAP
jgi:hypothetical protein